MEIDRYRKCLRTLAREATSRVLRASEYCRKIHDDHLELSRAGNESYVGRVLCDIDTQLGGLFADIAKCVPLIRSAQKECELLQLEKILVRRVESLHKLLLLMFPKLPHGPPPVELKRFSRVIARQILQLVPDGAGKSGMTDDLGIEVIPYNNIDDVLFSKLTPEVAHSSSAKAPDSRRTQSFSEYIRSNSKYVRGASVGIPRVDSSNPLRWSTAVHEIAHACCGDQVTASILLRQELSRSLTDDDKKIVDEASKKRDINRWLLETWCDLFAAVAIGPGFWRAQTIAFLANVVSFREDVTHVDSWVSHPPSFFRLRLIWEIIARRFPPAMLQRISSEHDDLIDMYEMLDNRIAHGCIQDSDTNDLMQIFLKFFQEHFFRRDSSSDADLGLLRNVYDTMMKKWVASSPDVQNAIETELRKGIPVPTVSGSAFMGGREEPVLVQELLVGSWIVFSEYEQRILHAVQNHESAAELFAEGGLRNGIQELEKLGSPTAGLPDSTHAPVRYERLDLAVMRSMQISEWVHYLHGNNIEKTDSARETDEQRKQNFIHEFCNATAAGPTLPGAVAIDFELFQFLKERRLRLVPLVDLDTQLGSSSIDLRIGPTFEIAVARNVGWHSREREEAFEYRVIDLDLGQYFEVKPGQFVLASTMEYVVLDDGLTGEIEGRSSFARMGLEVHKTAAFIDNGFQGCITLEIYNSGPEPIRLTPGDRICQLRLFRTNRPQRSYSRKRTAKYGGRLTHLSSMRKTDMEGRLIEQFRRRIAPNG